MSPIGGNSLATPGIRGGGSVFDQIWVPGDIQRLLTNRSLPTAGASDGYQIAGWNFALCEVDFLQVAPAGGITEVKLEMFGQQSHDDGLYPDLPADSGQREGFYVRREWVGDVNLFGKFQMWVDLSAVNAANAGDNDPNHVYNWFRFRYRLSEIGGTGVTTQAISAQLMFVGKNSARDISV
jgi:hypothetical protein